MGKRHHYLDFAGARPVAVRNHGPVDNQCLLHCTPVPVRTMPVVLAGKIVALARVMALLAGMLVVLEVVHIVELVQGYRQALVELALPHVAH